MTESAPSSPKAPALTAIGGEHPAAAAHSLLHQPGAARNGWQRCGDCLLAAGDGHKAGAGGCSKAHSAACFVAQQALPSQPVVDGGAVKTQCAGAEWPEDKHQVFGALLTEQCDLLGPAKACYASTYDLIIKVSAMQTLGRPVRPETITVLVLVVAAAASVEVARSSSLDTKIDGDEGSSRPFVIGFGTSLDGGLRCRHGWAHCGVMDLPYWKTGGWAGHSRCTLHLPPLLPLPPAKPGSTALSPPQRSHQLRHTARCS